MDGAGNLYGTTLGGGNQKYYGTIFKLTPASEKWTETVLYSFCSQSNCNDGYAPYAPLFMDAAGNLYGTTLAGGGSCSLTASGCGVVFQLAGAGGYALSVTKSGSGSVTSSPSGIDCGSACSTSFAAGTQVTLTATPASGSSFAGWGGACSGTGNCNVVMDASKSVSATFLGAKYTLSVASNPGGIVTSSPSGIDCGSTCSASFAPGTQVTLTAIPATGWGHAWNGACGGLATSCDLTMNANLQVLASFNPLFSTVEAPAVSSPEDATPLTPPIIGPLPQ
jgi:uncharacterized repeat protein (TIGR03803 family)